MFFMFGLYFLIVLIKVFVVYGICVGWMMVLLFMVLLVGMLGFGDRNMVLVVCERGSRLGCL